jgi:transcriptional regulator with XRE-family HTH domain
MPERSGLVEALKRCLKARGMTYAQLARELRISEPSVKRMFSRGSFTLRRLEDIVGVLEMELHEVARMASRSAGPVELTLEQEQGLAKDEKLLSVFWLLLNGWNAARITDAFAISAPQLALACAQLERLRLIEWGPRERVRLRVAKDFRWRAGGPVKRAYGNRVMQEFLGGRFDAPLEMLRFETREMSRESAAVLRRRLERLVADFNELAELDGGLPARERIGVGMLVAGRPWEFSVVNALKRRRPA